MDICAFAFAPEPVTEQGGITRKLEKPVSSRWDADKFVTCLGLSGLAHHLVSHHPER